MTAALKPWRATLGLLALSLVPVVAGSVRLAGLATGTAVTPETARFAAAPIPFALHIACAVPYCLLGAFQFAPAFRRRFPAWHRRAGRVLGAFGLVAAVSGVWMAIGYDIPAPMQGPLLLGVRLAAGLAMAAAIVLGVGAILRRDVARHEAWMTRAYALGQGAGTQVLALGPGILVLGEVVGLTRDLLMSLAWFINLAVAEHLILRARHPSPVPHAAVEPNSLSPIAVAAPSPLRKEQTS